MAVRIKGISQALCALVAVACLACSCSEQDEVSEYADWKVRNERFVDSIASVASTNADGTWEIIKSYTVGDSAEIYLGHNEYFIYVKKLETGTGTTSPLYSDSIRVHYSGRLMPTGDHPQGYNFAKSYSGNTLNEETDVPTLFGVSQSIVGFGTALMHMHEGDRWLVYVPYYLGYGTSDYTSAYIPAYSTLIYDMKLARIYRYGIDTDTSWH